MINAHDAVACARGFLGTPYGEMDCIRLIVQVIRKSPGGDAAYRCEGTNWLWRSIQNSSKYRHLTWRQEGTSGAAAGMLAFKKNGDDVHHVGLVTGEGTVIHSSSVHGRVVETPLDGSWHLLSRHRDIAAQEASAEAETDGAHASYNGSDAGPHPSALWAATFPRGEGLCTDAQAAFTSLVREEDGAVILLGGRWRVAQD